MVTTYLFILALFVSSYLVFKKKVTIGNIIIIWIHVLAFFAFMLFFLLNSNEYNVAIDALDEGYTPFGWEHIWTLFAFYALYLIAKGLLWFKSTTLPPLTWVVSCALVIIGILIWMIIIAQTSIDYPHEVDLSDAGPQEISSVTPFLFYPLITNISSLYILLRSFDEVTYRFDDYNYTNPTLNYLHGFLLKRRAYPLAIILAIFLIFFLVTAILMLFGQEYDSMVKVFTDTTTWRFSQKSHPPPFHH